MLAVSGDVVIDALAGVVAALIALWGVVYATVRRPMKKEHGENGDKLDQIAETVTEVKERVHGTAENLDHLVDRFDHHLEEHARGEFS